MKKLIFGIAALFMMSIVLVGCGDKKSKKDKDDVDEDERSESRYDDEDEDEDDSDMDMKAFTRGGSPEEQMMGYMEDMVELLKNTHVSSVDDIKRFAEKAKKIKYAVEDLEKSVGEDYESSLSEEEQNRMEKKIGELTSQIFPELQRIQQEAAEAGLSAEDMAELSNAF